MSDCADPVPAHRGGVLIYDGDCGFCTSSASIARRFLPSSVGVEPWQSLDLASLGLQVADVTSAAYFVDPDHTRYRGHAAVGRSLEQMTQPCPILGWLIRHPPLAWIARPAYWVVARYRYRLPGSTDACRIG